MCKLFDLQLRNEIPSAAECSFGISQSSPFIAPSVCFPPTADPTSSRC